MFILCVINVGLIPPISSCFQANTSILCFKKWIRRSRRLWPIKIRFKQDVSAGRQAVLVLVLLWA